jgi:hypothetical protein
MTASLSDQSLETRFREQGYVLLRGVVCPQEIAQMRETCDRFFADGGTHMFTRDYLRFRSLASVPFRPALITQVRRILGHDYATITQFSLTANLHSPVWHRDSQSAGDRDFLWDEDYLICKCGMYLQDNDREWGGGLEIVPGSHRRGLLGHQSRSGRDGFAAKVLRRAQRFARDSRDGFLPRIWLPLKAGDVLLFHANLIHRASQPLRSMDQGYRVIDPPPDRFKYMIQWEVSANNRHLPVYLAHQASRRVAAHRMELYRQSLESRFPEDYPPEVVEEIRRSGLTVANYSDADIAARKVA